MPYKDVDVPDETPPSNYTYHQRRAELFRMIIEAGHPDLLNQTQLAQYYDVEQSTISRDLKAIKEDVRDELGTDAKFITATIYQKALKAKAENDEWMDAVDILESWNEWLFETGAQDRAPQKHELDHDGDFTTPDLADENKEHFAELTQSATDDVANTIVDASSASVTTGDEDETTDAQHTSEQ